MGVTTVLSVINKPALIQWAANMAVDHVKNSILEDMPNIKSKDDCVYLLKNITDWLDQAKSAHRKKKEKAGDWGTNVHKAIEEWVKEGKWTMTLDEKGLEVFTKFRNWAKDNKVKFLESEKHVWSEKMWVGGIADLVIEMDGKKYIADIKTSSGIYNEHFFQMAAYSLCLEDMGEHKDVEGYLVINLKKDGTMATKTVTDMLQNREAFKHALGLYKITNALN